MAERLADIETIVEFVRKHTPCINGETTMECVERSIRNAPTIEAKPVVCAHREVTANGEGEESPCQNCKQKEKCTSICLSWQAWFKEKWRKIRESAGYGKY